LAGIVIGRYIDVVTAAERAKAAEEAVERASPKDKIDAEIKAHRRRWRRLSWRPP
jgi:hypothetical protein